MITENPDGSITFTVFLPDAERTELLGDFTDWHARPVPLRRGAGGWWALSARIPPGEYLFSYLVDGRSWLPDYAAHGVRACRTRRWVSQLIVPPESTTAPVRRTRRRRPRPAPVRSAA